MKKLNEQVIIYDDSCPMCTVYTGSFVRLGWLSKRMAFSRMPEQLLQQIDVDRGRHEIPLYNNRTGETTYGLDALFLIIGSRFPGLNPLFRNEAFRFFWKQIYWVITYNRRIIAGSPRPVSGMDCAPDRHLGYRWAYLILIGALSFLLLRSLPLAVVLQSPWAGAASALLIAALLLGLAVKSDRISWAGHWVTVLFLTSFIIKLLLLVPVLLPAIAFVTTFFLWKRWKIV